MSDRDFRKSINLLATHVTMTTMPYGLTDIIDAQFKGGIVLFHLFQPILIWLPSAHHTDIASWLATEYVVLASHEASKPIVDKGMVQPAAAIVSYTSCKDYVKTFTQCRAHFHHRTGPCLHQLWCLAGA